jgi:hypothetical protein
MQKRKPGNLEVSVSLCTGLVTPASLWEIRGAT